MSGEVPPSGLRVRCLTVSYGRELALLDVDVDAPAGTVTGVVGPNGAGKSTLLKAVLGLVPVDAGVVSIDGRPVDDVRARVAYLPQRADLDRDYPVQVGEVVAMGRYPHLGLWRRPGRRDRELTAAALDRVGLADLARRPFGELSGGQQQRVLVARALAQQATLLLLDEPFTGIDSPAVSLLTSLLRELAEEGCAVVVVNHDLVAVGALCDHLVLLARQVVAAGPSGHVLSPETLERAYGRVT